MKWIVLVCFTLTGYAQTMPEPSKSRVVDLTVTTSETLPANWADMPRFQRWTYNWFTPLKNAYGEVISPSEGPYYGQRYVIDEHTGTQVDFPAHFIPPSDSKLPFAGEQGRVTGDKYPLERLMGFAVVIDVTSLLDKAPAEESPHYGCPHPGMGENAWLHQGRRCRPVSQRLYRQILQALSRRAPADLRSRGRKVGASLAGAGARRDGLPSWQGSVPPGNGWSKYGARRGRAGDPCRRAETWDELGGDAHQPGPTSGARRFLHRIADQGGRPERQPDASYRTGLPLSSTAKTPGHEETLRSTASRERRKRCSDGLL